MTPIDGSFEARATYHEKNMPNDISPDAALDRGDPRPRPRQHVSSARPEAVAPSAEVVTLQGVWRDCMTAWPPAPAYLAATLQRPGCTLKLVTRAIRSAALSVARGDRQGSPIGVFSRKVAQMLKDAQVPVPVVVH